MAKAPAIGIDLGTTNSCVGVVRHGKVEIIANELGLFVTPSYVAFTEDERLIGDAAKHQAAINAQNTIFDAKRLIGRKLSDPTVQADMRHWPFALKEIGSEPRIEITYNNEKRLFSPEEVSAMVLLKMKETAESYLNTEITNAVITVPAYFNNGQRQATLDAGRIAGLNVLRLISEPTAAAIAYGWNHRDHMAPNTNILVFDLGGGTFDVTILSIKENMFVVKSTAGDTHLGGEDFDCNLVEFCVAQFKRKHKKDIQDNKRALRRLRTACESAKRFLSSATSTDIYLESLCDGIDFKYEITRSRFEELNAAEFRKTLEPLLTALEDAEMEKTQIDIVLLVGGSTRIPKIQKLIQEFFDGKTLDKSINPEEAVAYGAAIHAAILNGDHSSEVFGVLLKDVTPLSLGVNYNVDDRTRVLIKRNTNIPAENSRVFSTMDDNQTGMRIRIVQGEHKFTNNNYLLGEFIIDGIPKAPKGVGKCEETFSIDENGVLTVTAQVVGTDIKKGIRIENINAQFRKDQIQKMIAEAEKYRVEEKNLLEGKCARNDLERECREIREKLQDNRNTDLQPGQETSEIVEKCDEFLYWIEDHPREQQQVYENRHKELKTFVQRFCDKIKGVFSVD